jgi:hypothetical protein
VANTILLTTMTEPGGAAEQELSCRGQIAIQDRTNEAVQSDPIDLSVTMGDRGKLALRTGDGKILAPRITSYNRIQLKFATKEFVGEYFHYTGDLFLIYPSGHLARLKCSHT